MEYYFKLESLAAGYDGKPVVSEVEASLPKGNILTLIGPNGSGKSTVLKTVAKQLKAVAGVVSVGGDSVDALSPREMSLRAAVMLTERPRPQLMTCGDVVAAGRYPYTGMLGILSEADRQKVSEAMRMLNIASLADISFDRVSDGQRQRVLLARAVCQEPELLILDEPTSYLDIRYAVETLDCLRRLAESGVTVIMSLHELSYAKRVSDLVMCVKESRVMCLDRPEIIFTKEIISRLYDLPEAYYGQLFGGL